MPRGLRRAPQEQVPSPHAQGRLHAALDEPVSGAVLPREPVLVRGWATTDAGPVEAVAVTLAGCSVGAALGQPRPDVAAHLPELAGASTSGWQAWVDLGALQDDEVELVVTARFGGTVERIGTATVSLSGEPPPPIPPLQGNLDNPSDGDELHRGRCSAWGWVVDEAGPVSAVLLLVDGSCAAVVRPDLPRPDLPPATSDLPDAPRIGFAARIDLGSVGGDEAQVTALAIRRGGLTTRVGSARVRISPGPPSVTPIAHLAGPMGGGAVKGGVVSVSGHAIFGSGAPARVELSVDGVPTGRARLGLPRVGVTEEDEPSASICGFEALIDLGAVAPAATAVTIGAVAIGMAGERCEAPPVLVRAVPPDLGRDDDDRAEAERLRARTDRLAIRSIAGDARPGVNALVVTHHLGYGGAQLYLLELLRRLRGDEGVRATVVAPEDGPLRSALEDLDCPVHISGTFPLSTVAAYEGWIAQVAAWAAGQGFTTALVNTMLAFPGADLAERLALPVIWAVHESYPLSEYWEVTYPRNHVHAYVRERAEQALRRAAAVVFVADATRDQYAVNGDPARFVTIPYGIDLAAVDVYRQTHSQTVVRRRLGLRVDDILITCVGNFEPRKGQSVLAQCLAAVHEGHPKARLALVGDAPDPYSAAIHRYVEGTGLGDVIRLVPRTADPLAWLICSDLFVCASDVESLPRSALEAMACDVPVLSTDVFGLADLIEDGRTGWLIPPRDAASLRDALDRVLRLPAQSRAAVGRAGGDHVRAAHDAAGYADAFRSLLHALASDPRALPAEVLGTSKARPASVRRGATAGLADAACSDPRHPTS